jgi:hypothetical protein
LRSTLFNDLSSVIGRFEIVHVQMPHVIEGKRCKGPGRGGPVPMALK